MTDINLIVAFGATCAFIGFAIGWGIASLAVGSASHSEPNENGVTGV